MAIIKQKPLRSKEAAMATTITMPKKDDQEPEPPKIDQHRPTLRRFRLQVDRQTKSSFDTMAEADAKGRAIKKQYPIVQVSIYDAEKSQQTLL